MWVLAIIALVSLAGLIRGILVMDSLPFDETLAQVVIMVVAGGLSVFFFKARKSTNKFLQWLAENAEVVRNGGALYESVPITSDTVLRSYQTTVSVVVFSMKEQTRFYVAGQESGALSGIFCTITSLVFGWWGIPWGPIWTVQSLLRNIRGGSKQKVGDLLSVLEAAVQEEIQKKMVEAKPEA